MELFFLSFSLDDKSIMGSEAQGREGIKLLVAVPEIGRVLKQTSIHKSV